MWISPSYAIEYRVEPQLHVVPTAFQKLRVDALVVVRGDRVEDQVEAAAVRLTTHLGSQMQGKTGETRAFHPKTSIESP